MTSVAGAAVGAAGEGSGRVASAAGAMNAARQRQQTRSGHARARAFNAPPTVKNCVTPVLSSINRFLGPAGKPRGPHLSQLFVSMGQLLGPLAVATQPPLLDAPLRMRGRASALLWRQHLNLWSMVLSSAEHQASCDAMSRSVAKPPG